MFFCAIKYAWWIFLWHCNIPHVYIVTIYMTISSCFSLGCSSFFLYIYIYLSSCGGLLFAYTSLRHFYIISLQQRSGGGSAGFGVGDAVQPHSHGDAPGFSGSPTRQRRVQRLRLAALASAFAVFSFDGGNSPNLCLMSYFGGTFLHLQNVYFPVLK